LGSILGYFVATVKNLRGVVLVNSSDKNAVEKISWLIKRFRYRNLGIPPSLYSRRDLKEYFSKGPFIELVYPINSIRSFVEKLWNITGYPLELIESLVLSSIYVSPLLIAGSEYIRLLEDIAYTSIQVCRELSNNEWKLHLRIADYTILDMYREKIGEAVDVIKYLKGNKWRSIKEVLDNRMKRVEKDTKRYWRIVCKDEEGSLKKFLLYIDLLNLLVELSRRGSFKLEDLREDYSIALSIVPAINLMI